MKDMIKITLSLVVIFIAAGFIMGGTFKMTSPVKYVAEQKEKREALKAMAPEADENDIKEVGKWTSHEKQYDYYDAKAGGKTVAYIASTAGKGYSSYIKILVSIDKDLKVKNLKVLSHQETPGLGDQILEAPFLEQFKGKALTQIVLVKTETTEKIQAISGATISSRAVTNGVKDAVQMLVDKYGSSVSSAAGAKGHEGSHNK
ncbi:MAG TPA: RnfABCDGE type electron transport complex subunit G [Nitrospirota bacterium]|nr:RnfABCDGE type electron transport complex subunit G [Nitrospirota bacterium]